MSTTSPQQITRKPLKKALVIGSKGNIGKPLIPYLKSLGYEVMESDIKPAWHGNYFNADITQPLDLLPAFDWGPDVVFMLAGMVSRVTCEQASSMAVDTNLGGVQNVIDLCRRANARMVYMSTSEVYGPELEVMSEDATPKPNNLYGLSKLLGESLVEYACRTYGLKAVSLRPFMMYDENEDFGDHRSAMIRFAWRLAQGLPIEVHKGSARGWIHVSDAMRVIEAAAHVDNYEVVNVGHPDIRPIEDMAELIRSTLGADTSLMTIKDLPERMTLAKNPTLDKQENILGITPKISFEEGIQRVCAETVKRLENTSGHSAITPDGSSAPESGSAPASSSSSAASQAA